MRRGAPAAVVAFAAVVVLGGQNGGFLADTWGWTALPLLLIVAGVIAVQRPALARWELALVAALTALTAWTALSALWAPTAGPPVLEAERALLYTAAVAAVLLLDARGAPAGVLAAAAVLCVWALLSHHGARLEGPVGYANGLGLVAAIGALLALRRRATLVLLAVFVPALILTYSRGSLVALAAGVVVLAALRLRARPRLLAALAGVCVLAAAAYLLGAHRGGVESNGNVSGRLTSISGNGRGGYWRVALHEARAHPALGGGAGTWSRWWLLRRPNANGALDAHSLYLETLAELGPFGLALLLVALALPFAGARRAPPTWTAAYVALLVHAALDWDWELPAVALCGLLCGAALVAAASRERRVLLPARVAVVAVAAAAAVFVLQVGNAAISSASYALNANRLAAAAHDARRADDWQPWSTQPKLLLGEAKLAAGNVDGAAADFERVVRRDPGDWEGWYQLALATTGTRHVQARARAEALNPRGPAADLP